MILNWKTYVFKAVSKAFPPILNHFFDQKRFCYQMQLQLSYRDFLLSLLLQYWMLEFRLIFIFFTFNLLLLCMVIQRETLKQSSQKFDHIQYKICTRATCACPFKFIYLIPSFCFVVVSPFCLSVQNMVFSPQHWFLVLKIWKLLIKKYKDWLNE